MSKIRKARKLRTPNVPLSTGPVIAAGVEPSRTTSLSEPQTPTFDYSEIRKDLTRIGILAVSFIAVLVALSFFIR